MIYKAFYFSLKPYSIEKTEVLAAMLDVNGFEGISEEGQLITGYIPSDNINSNIIEELKSTLAACGCILTWTVEDIPEQNWNSLWESNFEPVIIDTRCVIRAPFHREFPELLFQITIEPKMSFGTGHHFTTRLMMEKILETNFKGKKVLDMGCGTGILAILSSMCGAAKITAIDIDKWAYENTIENIQKNNRKNIQVILGGKDSIPDDKYDIITANINRNILIDQMQDYANITVGEGLLILSGILKEDVRVITKKAVKEGYYFESDKILGEWVMLTFRRK